MLTTHVLRLTLARGGGQLYLMPDNTWGRATTHADHMDRPTAASRCLTIGAGLEGTGMRVEVVEVGP